MPRLRHLIVCAAAVADQASNRISAIEIIDQISCKYFPSFLPRLAIISSWSFDADELGKDSQIAIVLLRPSEANSERFNWNVKPEQQSANLIQRFVAMPISSAGDLRVELHANGTLAHSILIPVLQVSEESYADGLAISLRKSDGGFEVVP